MILRSEISWMRTSWFVHLPATNEMILWTSEGALLIKNGTTSILKPRLCPPLHGRRVSTFFKWDKEIGLITPKILTRNTVCMCVRLFFISSKGMDFEWLYGGGFPSLVNICATGIWTQSEPSSKWMQRERAQTEKVKTFRHAIVSLWFYPVSRLHVLQSLLSTGRGGDQHLVFILNGH